MGHLKKCLILAIFLLHSIATQEILDDEFNALSKKSTHCIQEGVVCPLTIDNVLDIESNAIMETPTGCQYMCFRERFCQNFTFFKNSAGQSRCVLFRDCEAVSPCRQCISGPARPTSEVCKGSANFVQTEPRADEEVESDEINEEQEEAVVTDAPGPEVTSERSFKDQETRRPKQFEDDVEGEGEGSEESADQINVDGIDDGLLEEVNNVTDEEDQKPVTKNRDREQTTSKPGRKPEVITTPRRPPTKPEKQEEDTVDIEANNGDEAFDDDYFEDTVEQNGESVPDFNNKSSPSYFHCLIGGYGVNGPISSISHFGSTVLNRNPALVVPPLPPSFPLGDEGVFSTVHSKSLYVCSPGAASTNDQFFSFFGGPTRSLFPGLCLKYTNSTDSWQPLGSPMNTFRGGAAFTRMGRFIVVTGGRRFPAVLNSVEVLNTAKPQKWKQLSRITLPNPTYDHCVVAINKTTIFVTGGFGQESHATMIDMKEKKTVPQDAMKQPRRQHTCQKAQINGRDGVLVAGGSSDIHPALASVEFFDLKQAKWLNLKKLREPRRFPSILVMSNYLFIAGGETTDPLGRTIILDSIEALQGNRWIPLRQKMNEGRSRFVTQRIPKSIFL